MDSNEIFNKFNLLNLNNQNQFNFFSSISQSQNDDEENEIIVLNDEKTELSQIKELDNDSRSVTESIKSSKGSQLNLRENLNINEEKKDNEFLRPHDIKLNVKNNEHNFINNMNNNNIKNNNININNNNQFDFEDLVNKKYGLFPII